MGRSEAGDDRVMLLLRFDITQRLEPKGTGAQVDHLTALGVADLIGRLLESRAHRSGIEAHDPEIRSTRTERDMTDRTVGGIVMRPHSLTGKEDHDLVEIPAGGADVVVLHSLCEIDDFHVGLKRDPVHLGQRDQQVEGERGGAGHAATGDIAIENGVEASGDGEPFTLQEPCHAEREARPGLLVRSRFGNYIERDIDQSVRDEITAKEAEASRIVRLVGHPDEAVCADPEKLGAVVVPMLHPQTEPGGGTADLCSGKIESGLCGQIG